MDIKEFDLWNVQKKNISQTTFTRFYKEREVWWCNLGKNIGSEQDGKGDYYERPVLVIKAFSRSVCLIIPLTTSTKESKFYYKVGLIDGKDASVVISQIKLVDTRRLTNRISILNDDIFQKIRKTIRDLF
jgi:mRNA interferase MazF